MSLSALIRKREASRAATAIPAISAIQKTGTAATVARIATIAVATRRAGTTSPVWLIHHPNRRPAEVHFWPPATLVEALAIYPAAISAEPARQQEPARSCRTCRHLHRPGLSDGHCGGRDDLPPAYTAGHPLRRLPDDGGASCAAWDGWT